MCEGKEVLHPFDRCNYLSPAKRQLSISTASRISTRVQASEVQKLEARSYSETLKIKMKIKKAAKCEHKLPVSAHQLLHIIVFLQKYQCFSIARIGKQEETYFNFCSGGSLIAL